MILDWRHSLNGKTGGAVFVARFWRPWTKSPSRIVCRLFLAQSDIERIRICRRIEQDVMGRMLEDIVLCETIRAVPYRRDPYRQLQVFKLVFERGEFDMVVFDPEKLSCRLYEVKHAAERDDGQLRHLVDPEKLAWAERNYGTILARTVLYRGESYDHPSGVAYRNVGAWLKTRGLDTEMGC